MAEPDNIVLEFLRGIRADLGEVKQPMAAIEDRSESVETKLDGLTHLVVAGFGSVVHRLDGIGERVSRLERERT